MTKSTTKLELIRYYIEDAGYRPMVRFSFDREKDPQVLICTTVNHTYKLAFNAAAWSIGFALVDNLGRETRGHQPGGLCPYCPTPITKNKE